jgi:hypothetical protein
MNGLNQMIAQGVRPIQIESPLNRMAQFEQIRGAQQANMLRQQQMAEMQRQQEQTAALNQLYQQAFDPATGRIDESRLFGGMAQGGFGSAIPAKQEQFAKGREATAKASAAQFKAASDELGAILNAASSAVDQPSYDMALTNLRRLGVDVSGVPRVFDPNYVAQAARQAMDAKQRVDAELKREEMNRPEFIDAGGVRVPVNRLTGQPLTGVPSIEQQPLPADVEAQKSRLAKAGATSVNVSTERAYGGKIAALAAEQDIALADQAAAIPRNIAKVDEALDLLYNSDINTGLGAEVFNVMDKARAKFISDKKAGKRVESTEYLDALLGSDVFPQISALGIGARGLDTPAEREFLRNVITGTINLDKSTLIRMTEFRRRGLEDAAKVYNSKVERGELDKYFEFTGRPKNRVEVPEKPSRSQGPATATAAPPAAVNFLKQNDTSENRRFFDQKYGAGAARSVLGR